MGFPEKNALAGIVLTGLVLASCGPGAASARQAAALKSETPAAGRAEAIPTPMPSDAGSSLATPTVPPATAPEAPATPTAPSSSATLPAPSSPPAPQVWQIILSHTPAQQSLSASCEAAAAALAMRVAGHPASEQNVIAAMAADPRPPELNRGTVVRWGNPSKAFVGNQDGWWPWARYDPGHPTGYGVHAPPVLDALHRLGAPNAHGGTGISLDTLREAIRSRHPVVIWLPSRHDFERESNPLATATWTAWDGTTVTYALHEHTQTLLGADEGGFYVGTPDYQWTPSYPFLSYWTNAEFARAFAFLGNMAIIVE